LVLKYGLLVVLLLLSFGPPCRRIHAPRYRGWLVCQAKIGSVVRPTFAFLLLSLFLLLMALVLFTVAAQDLALFTAMRADFAA
jgi:hypothetical protein